jgi:hypothetical protein
MSFAGRIFSGLIALGVTSAPVMAQESEIIFSRKAWQVEIVGFDDGTYGCVAHVTKKQGSFSIWIFQDDTARLQFFSDQWKFDGGTANLEVQIDKRAAWTLTNAELYEQSILFNLPNSNDGERFAGEVAAGNTIFLRDEDGKQVRQFSLAGSRASMGALAECGEVIVQDAQNSGAPPMQNSGAAGNPGGGNRTNPFQ